MEKKNLFKIAIGKLKLPKLSDLQKFLWLLLIPVALIIILISITGYWAFTEKLKETEKNIIQNTKTIVLDSLKNSQSPCDTLIILYPEKVAFGEYSFQSAAKPGYNEIGSCEISFNYKGKKVVYVLRVTNMQEILSNQDEPINGITNIKRFKNYLRELGKSQVNNIEITARPLPNDKLEVVRVVTIRGGKIIWETQGISFE